MTALLGVLAVAACCLSFSIFLGRVVFTGLASGQVRHTDSSAFCDKNTNPLGYWALILLFPAMALLSVAIWVDVLYDSVARYGNDAFVDSICEV